MVSSIWSAFRRGFVGAHIVESVLVGGCCGVVFVWTTRRRRGGKVHERLSLVESVRDGSKVGHRTLLRLGEVSALRESGQLERIVAAMEAHLRGERVDVGALAAQEAPAVGAVAAVATVWSRLGLDGWFAWLGSGRGSEALGHAVFAMVSNRLVAPCSKRHLVEWAAQDLVMFEGWEAPLLDQYYRNRRRGRRCRVRPCAGHQAAPRPHR